MPRKPLVVSLDKRGMIIAHVQGGNGKCQVTRWQRFGLPDSLDWTSAELEKPLARFLSDGRWAGHTALLGLSSDYCLFHPITMPLMDVAMLSPAISIQCEQQFNQNGQSIVVDYAPPISDEKEIKTALVAISESLLKTIVDRFAAAGVKISHVCPTVFAVNNYCPQSDPQSIILHVTGENADLAIRNNQQIVAVHHLACSPEDTTDVLSRELRQLRLMTPVGESTQSTAIRLLNDSSISDQSLQEILSDTGFSCDYHPAPVDCNHATAALTGQVGHIDKLPIDFLNTKLHAKATARFGRRSRRIVAAAILVLAAALLYFWDVTATSADITQLNDQLTTMRDDIAAARNIIDRTVYARKWFSRQPRHLACQKSLSEAFGYDGRTWATSIAISDEFHGLVTGNAVTERDVLEFLDRLKSRVEMKSVKLVYVRQSSGSNNHVGFAIRFQYSPDRSAS